MSDDSNSEALQYKEEGNKFYKDENYDEAIVAYTKALTLGQDLPKSDQAVFYKNRAACHLKLENNEQAAQDAKAALDLNPSDFKAMFRKCQALEALGQIEEAFKSAMQLNHMDPNNKSVQAMLTRMNVLLKEKVKSMTSTNSKVEQMFTIAADESAGLEKRREAANNLIVLAREPAGAERIFGENGVEHMKKLMTLEDTELVVAALRVISCLCGGHRSRATAVIAQLTLTTLAKYIAMDSEVIANAAAGILLTAIQAMLGKDKQEAKHSEEAVVPDYSNEFKALLLFFLGLLTDKSVSGYGRDAVIDMIIKFIPRKEGAGRAMAFLTNGGLHKLMNVAGQVPELKRLRVTSNTRMHASVALDKLYEEMHSDKQRAYYQDMADKFVSEKFSVNSMETNMEVLTAISSLLQGPTEVGQKLLTREGVLQVMIAMAASSDVVHQRVALEAIIYAAGKKEHCTGVLQNGINIMKDLYKSPNDHIKVRALVGLCKLGSAGGTDFSLKPLADGSIVKLAKQVRSFLVNSQKDHDLKKWSAEGLAYLSLDADVKEAIVDDPETLQALMDLSKTSDKTVLYGVVSTFVNLTNCYDVQKPEPQLVELARYAKQHIPEEHPKDATNFIDQRIKKLLKAGIVPALVALSKTESENSRELLSRVYLALVEDIDHRGLVVQQGGAKALVPLAIEGTLEGKTRAAQALAKIGITMNPEVAFPGQRHLEVVRPLVQLLDVQNTGLQNFEALMALTNLASMNDAVRTRIIKETGFSQVENYMLEDHDMIKQAATECMCNLVLNERAFNLHLGDNDRVKLLMLYTGEEDPGLVKAASGTLAILSSHEEVCDKIFKLDAWLELLQGICVNPDKDIQFRGVHIVSSIIESKKENAKKIVETNLLEVLMALTKDDSPENKRIAARAEEALDQAREWGLIQKA
ncbi:protein unc-45 homolog B [Strongylocentrotus purpuratus]|uniref:UNC-45/Cro1/She4 central domain-containing protein n=1 Tax=Strongylocentrotus purpuratus TaxID=7668 RepID=A0A7M7RHM1_STRPU|nr:protein unc-45 homolog B [Strongylocentrotus purpuratus]